MYLEKPGRIKIDVSYSFQELEPDGAITLTIKNSSLEHTLHPTGKYVGEPNQNWEIDSFNASFLGEIEITDKGFYNIQLKINPEKDKPVKFQWAWLSYSNP